MSLLAKVQQAARACISSGQHSSANLRQLCDHNLAGWLQPQVFSSPTSRGWCSSSTLAPSDESPPHTEVATISEPAASQTDTHERATDGLTPASRTEDDSLTTTTPAFLEVDFDVADTNYIRVTGNVGLDPQLRETAKGNSVTNLHMYVFQGKNNDAARISVQSWGDLALSVHRHIRKGMKIRVDGYLKQNIWLSKDAVRVSKLLVNATAIAVVKDRKIGYQEGDTYRPSQYQ